MEINFKKAFVVVNLKALNLILLSKNNLGMEY
jgi:hypothetical protein